MVLVTGVYCALSLLTFSNVYKAYRKLDKDVTTNEPLVAVLAATFFGSVMVVLYALVSFLTLLGKTTFRSGAGFTYGFITSSSVHMALMCLLCFLVLRGFTDQVEVELENDKHEAGVDWESGDTLAFKASFWLALVSTVIYLAFFVVLVCDKGAVRRQKEDKRSKEQNLDEEQKK